MSKILKKLFVLFAIVPLVCLCFVGCAKSAHKSSAERQKIILSTDNIGEYLVINHTLSPYGSSNNQWIANITTTKRKSNIEFFDCEIQVTCSEFGSNNHSDINVILDYEGKSQSSLKPIYSFYEIKITSVSGYILIDE